MIVDHGRPDMCRENQPTEDPNLKFFCGNCGTLIPFSAKAQICFPLCETDFDASVLEHFERGVDLVRLSPADGGREEVPGTRTVIKERCPECSHEGLFFSTVQLRNADEGQTVFYECPNCGHRFQQNA
jgi:DNA-directed RNA polymerase I subunit RPA12